ncbi:MULTISPECIES: MFS transporter [Leuconostoc]|jgi:MFS family permease|uniref:Permease of the major facilitator superfamily n=2 Tax=Leuconostoc TaxID=1243 RepID=A0AAN2QWC5_9LACO|nr:MULTISPECIES: MFS transporter [Leuconostoc]AFS40080.1 major facilitator superfamily transporter [Leuconostoc gelidum JB7]MBZ5943482.1 MFS transporter [Leuconostoc gasicomitatum]MBZ5946387.1 MFS transporter [Leuconostoc gasicomitatum]MBZ5948466.1 MFS transporter [Leuconostoc gasicomitatum]MBZ5950212.1 MFS transporter [Leuconostoc gasicomitatum]
MQSQDKWITKIAFLGISFMLTSAYAINGAMPQMTKALGVSATQVQALATTPSIVVTVFVLLSSFIAAKLGDKKTIMLGMLLVGFAGIVPFFVTSYPIILVSRMVLGAGFGIFNSLAVSMIAVMYQGQTRATMLGWRAAVEQIGQAVLTFIAGLLLNFGWQTTFLVYLLAFPILYLFYVRVPDTTEMLAADQKNNKKTHINRNVPQNISPLVWVLTLFAAFIVIDYMAIQLSFPFMAQSLGVSGLLVSTILSLMLVAAMVGGLVYGGMQKLFGRFTLQVGLLLMVLSNFLVAFSNGNFVTLTIGVLLIGFPMQLISPFIFSQLPNLAPLKKQPFVTSIVLIGFNVGVFVEPFALSLLAKIMGNETHSVSEAAYTTIPLLGIILLIIAGVTFITNRKRA